MSYPVIKIPDIYNRMHVAKPGKLYPQLPNKPQSIGANLRERFEKDALFTIFSFFVPIYISFFIAVVIFGDLNKTFGFLIGLILSICVLSILFAGASMLEVIVLYTKAIYNYKRDVKLHDEKYNQVLRKYQKDIYAWEKLEAKARDETYLISYRRKHFPENIKAFSGKIAVHPGHALVKKGAIEGKVFEILSAKFGDRILINHTTYGQPFVPMTLSASREKLEEEAKLNRFSPLPDFIIYDAAIGYCIVIEIDEPYDLEYGYPIHSIESNDLRDEYFLKRNWPIIRFAEIQFVLNAEGCCDFIADAINKLTLGLANLPMNVSPKYLDKVDCWTETDAISMEASGFRETYLPRRATDSAINRYAFSDAIYLSNGPAIRKRRRERALEEEAEREERRVTRLRQEDEAGRKYRYLTDKDNDLPF